MIDSRPQVFATLGLLVSISVFFALLIVWLAVKREPPSTSVVVAARLLPAGRVVTEADLGTSTLREDSGLVRVEKAVGRVTRRRVIVGEGLRPSDLGPVPPKGSVIVSSPLAERALALEAHEIISLYVASPKATVLLPRALVLKVEAGVIRFAVWSKELAKAAPLLADASVVPIRWQI